MCHQHSRYQSSHTCTWPPWPTCIALGNVWLKAIYHRISEIFHTAYLLSLNLKFWNTKPAHNFFYLPDKYMFGDNDTHCSRVWPACLFFCINTMQQKKRIRQMIDDQPWDLNFLLALKIRVPNFIFLKWLFCDSFELISFYSVAEWVWFPSTFLQKRKILIHSCLGTMFNYFDCVSWMNTLFLNVPDIPNSSKKKHKCRQPTCKQFFYLWRHWVEGDIV